MNSEEEFKAIGIISFFDTDDDADVDWEDCFGDWQRTLDKDAFFDEIFTDL